MNQYEREEDQYHRDFENGLMTQAELNKALRDLNREYQQDMRAAAEDAAEQAYRDTIGAW